MDAPAPRRLSTPARVALVLLALLLAGWAFLEFEPLRHRGLTFETVPGCEGSGGRRPGVYSTRWEGATLLIRAAEYPNCAEAVERVSAHVVGERVLLRIRYRSPSGESYACHCQKVVLVRLTGLEKRAYRILPVWAP